MTEQRGTRHSTSDNPNNENNGDGDNVNDSDDIIDCILPVGTAMNESERKTYDQFLKMAHCGECTPIGLNAIPFPLNKKSRTCQVCHYEMKSSKWKGVVFCTNHGVRLCTESSPPRIQVEPKLYKLDGAEVTDFSWTCPEEGSCWSKFHKFYAMHGLFNKKQIDINQRKIKFGTPIYTSQLYQRKYEALGIEIVKKRGRPTGMGKIVPSQHVRLNKN